MGETLMFKPGAFGVDGKLMLSGMDNSTNTNGSMAMQNSSTTPGSITFPPAVIEPQICQLILYDDIQDSRIRIWDLIILVPNGLFLLFIIWNLKPTVDKLKQSRSPIVTAFYLLARPFFHFLVPNGLFLLFIIWNMKPIVDKLKQSRSPIVTAFYLLVAAAAVISVLRCIVGMTVNATVLAGDITDKVLWLLLRFFMLATELSVIVFGIAFGHLDSRTSIQRVLLVTFTFAFLYSCLQGALEFLNPDPKFHVQEGAVTKNYDIFAHGGMIFWMTSSAFFTVVYSVIFILPHTRIRHRVNLPSKKSFYYYCLFLAILNCTQAVGSSLLYFEVLNGMCVVDATTFIYFTCFHPLVYGTFLREFFKPSFTNVPFSYKYQTDEINDDDNVSLPYQSANKYVPDNVSDSGSFDSTHFDRHPNIGGSLNADIYVPSSYSANDSGLYQNA